MPSMAIFFQDLNDCAQEEYIKLFLAGEDPGPINFEIVSIDEPDPEPDPEPDEWPKNREPINNY